MKQLFLVTFIVFGLTNFAFATDKAIIFSSVEYRSSLLEMTKTELTGEVSKHLASAFGMCLVNHINAGFYVAWEGIKTILDQTNSRDVDEKLRSCHTHIGKYIDATNLLIYGTFDPFTK